MKSKSTDFEVMRVVGELMGGWVNGYVGTVFKPSRCYHVMVNGLMMKRGKEKKGKVGSTDID